MYCKQTPWFIKEFAIFLGNFKLIYKCNPLKGIILLVDQGSFAEKNNRMMEILKDYEK